MTVIARLRQQTNTWNDRDEKIDNVRVGWELTPSFTIPAVVIKRPITVTLTREWELSHMGINFNAGVSSKLGSTRIMAVLNLLQFFFLQVKVPLRPSPPTSASSRFQTLHS